MVGVGITGPMAVMDVDITGAEGGDLSCSRSLSLVLPCSEGSIQLVRLSILTATGTTIIKTLVLSQDTPGVQAGTITLGISAELSDMVPDSTGDGTE